MAAKSTLTNMVLCLTAVCLVCAALLGGVYLLTAAPIEAGAQKALNASISAVLPEGGELSEALSAEADGVSFQYYESRKDSLVQAYAVKSTTGGFGGPLTLMVGVLPDGTVYNTSVLSHSETPGLGAKCDQDENFMKQWRGFGPEKKLAVRKDGGDVDAITASTITSRAYTKAVLQAVNLVRGFSGMPVDAVSGATKKTEE
ncbi:MAG: RnfABCDGE type electron transport complex subunit G [Bacteroidales bacterium]|nr:RnfABCDGE type electron transport complex subunit G [Bacteroidales bacterium]